MTQPQLRTLYERCRYISFDQTFGFGWSLANTLQFGAPNSSRRHGVMTVPDLDLRGTSIFETIDELIDLVQRNDFEHVERDLDVLSPARFVERFEALAGEVPAGPVQGSVTRTASGRLHGGEVSVRAGTGDDRRPARPDCGDRSGAHRADGRHDVRGGAAAIGTVVFGRRAAAGGEHRDRPARRGAVGCPPGVRSWRWRSPPRLCVNSFVVPDPARGHRRGRRAARSRRRLPCDRAGTSGWPCSRCSSARSTCCTGSGARGCAWPTTGQPWVATLAAAGTFAGAHALVGGVDGRVGRRGVGGPVLLRGGRSDLGRPAAHARRALGAALSQVIESTCSPCPIALVGAAAGSSPRGRLVGHGARAAGPRSSRSWWSTARRVRAAAHP